ncbi:MAG: tetratricopeptide repeat protein [Pirellula sp.]|jgi:tetratricopeptide (TPR) repeat protein
MRSFTAMPFLHLYFIPVIPIGSRKRSHKLCGKCNQCQAFEPAVFDSIITRLKDQSADAIVALKSGDTTFDSDDPNEAPIECVPFLHSVVDWLYASNNVAFCESMLSQLTEPECRYAQTMLRAALETYRGKPDDAINTYREASQIQQQSFQPHHARGLLLAARKKTIECIEAYRSAIACSTPDIEYQLRLELVDIQTAAKQYTDAAATFDWLLAAKPDLLSNKDFMKLVNKNKRKAGIA